MRSRLRLAVGSGLESGVEFCLCLHPGSACIGPSSPMSSEPLVLPIVAGVDLVHGGAMRQITKTVAFSAKLFDALTHLRVLSNANGGVETDGRLGNGLPAGWREVQIPTVLEVLGIGVVAPSAALRSMVLELFAFHPEAKAHGKPIAKPDGAELVSRLDRHPAVCVGSGHSVTIAGTVPDAWGIGAGLRLGVEGDAGEWEWIAGTEVIAASGSAICRPLRTYARLWHGGA